MPRPPWRVAQLGVGAADGPVERRGAVAGWRHLGRRERRGRAGVRRPAGADAERQDHPVAQRVGQGAHLGPLVDAARQPDDRRVARPQRGLDGERSRGDGVVDEADAAQPTDLDVAPRQAAERAQALRRWRPAAPRGRRSRARPRARRRSGGGRARAGRWRARSGRPSSSSRSDARSQRASAAAPSAKVRTRARLVRAQAATVGSSAFATKVASGPRSATRLRLAAW